MSDGFIRGFLCGQALGLVYVLIVALYASRRIARAFVEGGRFATGELRMKPNSTASKQGGVD